MACLRGQQVAPSGKCTSRAPAARASRISARTPAAAACSAAWSRGSSGAWVCATASRSDGGLPSGPAGAGRTCRSAAVYDSPVFAARARTRRLRFLFAVIGPPGPRRRPPGG